MSTEEQTVATDFARLINTYFERWAAGKRVRVPPASDTLPLLDDDAAKTLQDDIAAHGLRVRAQVAHGHHALTRLGRKRLQHEADVALRQLSSLRLLVVMNLQQGLHRLDAWGRLHLIDGALSDLILRGLGVCLLLRHGVIYFL